MVGYAGNNHCVIPLLALVVQNLVLQMNPYEPPTTVNDVFGGFLWTLRVGSSKPDVVSVSGSLLHGIRTFVTDADGNRGPVYRGPVELEVGSQEVHAISIRVDETGKVTAHLDGTLVDSNLFPELRSRIQKLVWSFALVFSTFIGIVMLGGVVYFLGLWL